MPRTTSSTERCKDTEKIFHKSNCGHLSIFHIYKHWRQFSNKGCYNCTKISVFIRNGVQINAFSAISRSPWHRLPHCHKVRKMHLDACLECYALRCLLRVIQVLPFLSPNVQNGHRWSSTDLHPFHSCIYSFPSESWALSTWSFLLAGFHRSWGKQWCLFQWQQLYSSSDQAMTVYHSSRFESDADLRGFPNNASVGWLSYFISVHLPKGDPPWIYLNVLGISSSFFPLLSNSGWWSEEEDHYLLMSSWFQELCKIIAFMCHIIWCLQQLWWSVSSRMKLRSSTQILSADVAQER